MQCAFEKEVEHGKKNSTATLIMGLRPHKENKQVGAKTQQLSLKNNGVIKETHHGPIKGSVSGVRCFIAVWLHDRLFVPVSRDVALNPLLTILPPASLPSPSGT